MALCHLQSRLGCLASATFVASSVPRLLSSFRSEADWKSLVPEGKTYVGSQWTAAKSGSTFPVFNPANGVKLGCAPAMGAAETKVAVEAAAQSQNKWAALPGIQRASVIRRWADSIRQHKDGLAALITSENGKVLSDAQGEIASAVSSLEWYAEEAKRTYGMTIPSHVTNSRHQFVKYYPVGVVGMITPWNFPLSMITRKAGAALAAGCGVVLKPAEDTPLTALALTYLGLQEAGIPPGLLNVVTAAAGKEGAEAVGDVLCSSPLIRMISFTGSTLVGKMLYTKAASNLKRVVLELGGNAPFIVFPSANLDKAVAGAVACKFRCSGQTCVSANRIFVHESVHDQFLEKLTSAVKELKMGDGSAPDVRLGPLVNEKAVSKVKHLVEKSIEKGAKPVFVSDTPSTGYFFPATILSDCTPQMPCTEEEIFGPVAPIIKFSSDSEVIRLANDTVHGLSSYFYTSDLSQAWNVADQLRAGMIGINSGRVSSTELPFVGWKHSGIGHEGGPDALKDFMEIKTISCEID